MSVPPTETKGRAAGPAGPEIDDNSLKAKVAEVLDRWPSAGRAAGVVCGGSLEWLLGHGVADIESKEPVPLDLVFRIGSITKTFTASGIRRATQRPHAM